MGRAEEKVWVGMGEKKQEKTKSVCMRARKARSCCCTLDRNGVQTNKAGWFKRKRKANILGGMVSESIKREYIR